MFKSGPGLTDIKRHKHLPDVTYLLGLAESSLLTTSFQPFPFLVGYLPNSLFMSVAKRTISLNSLESFNPSYVSTEILQESNRSN